MGCGPSSCSRPGRYRRAVGVVVAHHDVRRGVDRGVVCEQWIDRPQILGRVRRSRAPRESVSCTTTSGSRPRPCSIGPAIRSTGGAGLDDGCPRRTVGGLVPQPGQPLPPLTERRHDLPQQRGIVEPSVAVAVVVAMAVLEPERRRPDVVVQGHHRGGTPERRRRAATRSANSTGSAASAAGVATTGHPCGGGASSDQFAQSRGDGAEGDHRSSVADRHRAGAGGSSRELPFTSTSLDTRTRALGDRSGGVASRVTDSRRSCLYGRS